MLEEGRTVVELNLNLFRFTVGLISGDLCGLVEELQLFEFSL